MGFFSALVKVAITPLAVVKDVAAVVQGNETQQP